jgi:hypothetical protein
MKIKFECSECACTWSSESKDMESLRKLKIECCNSNCPTNKPPETTYGPLTVEGVAEALRVAAYPDAVLWKDIQDQWVAAPYRRQARFVIRLLESSVVTTDKHGNPQQWLNDLAVDK